MISASAADAHRFGRVKKNGYDPVEVDAVMARLIEAIKSYETKIEGLEGKLGEADASADAIRRTFIAAEATREEIIEAAHDQSRAIAETARGDAEEILAVARTQAGDIKTAAEAEAHETTEVAKRLDAEVAERRDEVLAVARSQAADIKAAAEAEARETTGVAKRLDAEVAERRDEILSEAYDQAEVVAAAAEQKAADRELQASQKSDEMLSEITGRYEKERVEAEAAIHTAELATARLRTEAQEDASRIVAAAREEARAITDEAEAHGHQIRERSAELRAAILGLEESARNLATITNDEMAVIDLAEIEALDDSERTPTPEPVLASVTAPSVEEAAVAEIADPPPTVEAPPELIDEAPLLTVAEAKEELESETPEPPPAASGQTYYQRSTGTPLSERVKIARKS